MSVRTNTLAKIRNLCISRRYYIIILIDNIRTPVEQELITDDYDNNLDRF